MTPTNPPPDARRCTATSNRTGERCKNYAIKGGSVCQSHGGAARQVKDKAKQRLLEAADPAAAALAEIVNDDKRQDKDRIKAAKEILDRAGVDTPDQLEVGGIEDAPPVKLFQVDDADYPDEEENE